MKETFKLFLSMLVISIMLVGFAGAESTDSDKYELFEGEYYLPDYGSDTFELAKEDSNIIATWGTVPEIKDDKEKVDWLATIRPCIDNSKEDLLPYMISNGGPLLGFGTNYGGYIFVEFDEEAIDSVDKSTMMEIYNIINKNAEDMKISNVPIAYRINKDATLESRTTYWTNMIGGIQILGYNSTTNLWHKGTLSFSAEDSSGTPGFVMSAHVARDSESIGAPIYQCVKTRQVGVVTDYVPHFADAAWVEATNVNVDDDIYYADSNILKDVTSYGDTSQGAKVYKSGAKTGTTYGYVVDDYIVVNTAAFGNLYDQFSVDYYSAKGDSGAPVFRKTLSGVKIVGVHWGGNTLKFFSPISGVILDLDVTPIC